MRTEGAAAILNHFAAELAEGVLADILDQAFDLIARDQAAGKPRAFVKHPVARHPRSLGGALGVVAEEFVVSSDLAAGDVEPVLKAGDRAQRQAARGARADLDHVGYTGDPTDQRLATEDRHDRLDVGIVDVSDHRVVVAEDVAGVNAGVLFEAFANDVLDHIRHRVNVHDDSGRERNRIALRCVEREGQLTELLDDR
ncbi:unannotated protein [freshwater metagenome]|uniref:Unannotated protein n=1 Tax=freshwater metagenome TaxID=449393 RepID=A0A6J7RZR2_9ZZZZ